MSFTERTEIIKALCIFDSINSARQHQSGRQPLGGNGGDSQEESVVARSQSEWVGK
jgi:hypothetical protein